MTKRQRTLAMAIYTATQWHSDTGRGRALLSLGSTRKLHSEDHRAECLKDIDGDIAYCGTVGRSEALEFDPAIEISRLNDLRALVVDAVVGVEWLTDADNLRWNEELYQAGDLAWDKQGK